MRQQASYIEMIEAPSEMENLLPLPDLAAHKKPAPERSVRTLIDLVEHRRLELLTPTLPVLPLRFS